MLPNATKPKRFSWTRQKEQAASLVAEDDLTDAQIAAEVGVNKTTLERWKANPEFAARVQEHVRAYREAIRRKGIAIVENRVGALQDRWKRLQQIIEERAADPEMQEIPGGKTGMLVRQGKLVKVFDATRVAWPGEDAEYKAGDPCPRCSRNPECVARLELGVVENLVSGSKREALLCRLCLDRWRGDGDEDVLTPIKQSQIVWEYAVDTGLLKELREHEKQAAQELGQWTERQDVEIRDTSIRETLERKLARLASAGEAEELSGQPDAG